MLAGNAFFSVVFVFISTLLLVGLAVAVYQRRMKKERLELLKAGSGQASNAAFEQVRQRQKQKHVFTKELGPSGEVALPELSPVDMNLPSVDWSIFLPDVQLPDVKVQLEVRVPSRTARYGISQERTQIFQVCPCLQLGHQNR